MHIMQQHIISWQHNDLRCVIISKGLHTASMLWNTSAKCLRRGGYNIIYTSLR